MATIIFSASINSLVIYASPSLEINIFLPQAVNNPASLTSFGNQLGVHFSSAKFYLDWSDGFNSNIARGFKNQGVIPEITWQPQDENGGISFDNVLAGNYDGYINQFASDVASFGSNIRISLAPEINGDWEPWGIGNAGNNPENFKAFYRYVVEKFRTQGANNVDWILAYNTHYWGEPSSYADLFPGDSYVDFTGLDGYNWGNTQSWSSWQSFSEIFRSSYNDLCSISGKKIIITEFASTEDGGSKPQWILDMFRDVRSSFPRISGITWFNINKETDWRINSSSESLEAFKNGVTGDYGAIQSASQQQQNQNSAVESNSGPTPNGPANSSPQVIALEKTENYIEPLQKTISLSENPPIAVKAAKTFKANIKSYFWVGDIILVKMILEFLLFSIILIAAWLHEPKFCPEKSNNR